MKQYGVKNWEIEDEKSPFFGKHESGIVNIPEGAFTEEAMKAWLEDGTLTIAA